MLQIENTLLTLVMILYFAAMVLYFIFVAAKKDVFSTFALIAQSAGLALHTATLICRGIGAGRFPLTNQYEFATSFAWALCLVSLIFILKYKFRVLGVFAAPLILLIIGYAAMQSREVREVMPALRSSWLVFHVSTAIIAYGGFGVAFVLSVIYLLAGPDQLPERIPRHSFSYPDDPDRRDLGGTGLGKLLVLGSEGDLVSRDLDHLRGLPASSAAPGRQRESGRRFRRHRVYLRDLHLHRREHLPAGPAQLQVK